MKHRCGASLMAAHWTETETLWVNTENKHPRREEIQMANEHERRQSVSSVIKDIQNRTKKDVNTCPPDCLSYHSLAIPRQVLARALSHAFLSLRLCVLKTLLSRKNRIHEQYSEIRTCSVSTKKAERFSRQRNAPAVP